MNGLGNEEKPQEDSPSEQTGAFQTNQLRLIGKYRRGSMKKLKVIQWFTGDIAQHQIRLVAANPAMQLVGAFVFHDEKVGLDAGEIAGIRNLGVSATKDMDEILSVDADCVLYNPPTERYDQIIPILESGKNVISIMAGWNPKRYEVFPDIEEACSKGNASLFGTGLNPGLSYELAILGSSICHEVESVYIKTCERQSTLSPVFLEKFGFGRTEEQLRQQETGAAAIFDNLLQITDLICQELSIPHDGNSLTHEYEPSVKDYNEKIEIKKGTMAGLIVKASSTFQEVPKVTIELRFLLGTDYVSEEFLSGAPQHGWIEIDVRGTPGSKLTHEIYAEEKIVKTRSTGTKAVNAIPHVVAAKPGLISPTQMPLSRILPPMTGN